MKRSNEKVTVKWCSKDNDWVLKYPEWENRNARILGLNIIVMIEEFEKWKGEKLQNVIKDGGFNPDTFIISVNAKISNNDNK